MVGVILGLVSVAQKLTVEVVSTMEVVPTVEVVSTEDFREVLKKEVAKIILIILVRFITGYC